MIFNLCNYLPNFQVRCRAKSGIFIINCWKFYWKIEWKCCIRHKRSVCQKKPRKNGWKYVENVHCDDRSKGFFLNSHVFRKAWNIPTVIAPLCWTHYRKTKSINSILHFSLHKHPDKSKESGQNIQILCVIQANFTNRQCGQICVCAARKITKALTWPTVCGIRFLTKCLRLKEFLVDNICAQDIPICMC